MDTEVEAPLAGTPASSHAVRLLEPIPRSLVRQGPRREDVPSDWRPQLTQLEIYVEGSKGLPKYEMLKACNPYLVVKGIRSNAHFVDIFRTPVARATQSPHWDQRFLYTCPSNQTGDSDIVGLRFQVYDAGTGEGSFLGSDGFLGGADVDLVEQGNARTIKHELELAGMVIRKAKGSHHKKPRLFVDVKLWREYRPQPASASSLLLASLATVSRVAEIKGCVISAQGLRNADWSGKSDPYCVVRAIMLSGRVVQLFRTRSIDNCLEPIWNESFSVQFGSDEGHAEIEDYKDAMVAAGPSGSRCSSSGDLSRQWSSNMFQDEEPVLLVFDVFDTDEGLLMGNDEDDHLGTAYVTLNDCKSEGELLTLKLEGESTLLEKRLSVGGGTKRLKVDEHILRKSVIMKERIFSQRKKIEKQLQRSLLAIELTVKFTQRPMPLVELLQKGPRELAPGEDPGPGVIGAYDDLSSLALARKNTRRVLKGQERIVFIHGVVHGASGLSTSSSFGKSDPYAVVMGVSQDGQRVFIHRTRHISKTFAPHWNEVFSMAIDPLQEIRKLLVTVWDADTDVLTNGNHDFLGHASLDLSKLRSGEAMKDELPLLGVKHVNARGGVKAASGFIHDATVSVEVRVERRVQAMVEWQEEEKLHVRPRHQQSRDPPTSADYIDASQQDLYVESPQARRVLDLHDRGLLVRLGERKAEEDPEYAFKWLSPPQQGRRCLELPALPPHQRGQQPPSEEEDAPSQPPSPTHRRSGRGLRGRRRSGRGGGGGAVERRARGGGGEESRGEGAGEGEGEDADGEEADGSAVREQKGQGPAFDFSDVGSKPPRAPQACSLPALKRRSDRNGKDVHRVLRQPQFISENRSQQHNFVITEMQRKLPPSLLAQGHFSVNMV